MSVNPTAPTSPTGEHPHHHHANTHSDSQASTSTDSANAPGGDVSFAEELKLLLQMQAMQQGQASDPSTGGANTPGISLV